MKKILSFIAPTGFQDVEYADSKAALEEAGHQVITASDAPEAVGKFGSKVQVDVLLNDVKEEDYDALLLVGGPGIHAYFDDLRLHALARSFLVAGKVTAAICAAPSVLAKAALLEGKNATCFPGEQELLKSHGALVSGNGVEQDGLLVTAEGPESAHEFGERVSQLLDL